MQRPQNHIAVADREQSLTSLRLVVAVPALMARQALAEGKNRALYQRVLAARPAARPAISGCASSRRGCPRR